MVEVGSVSAWEVSPRLSKVVVEVSVSISAIRRRRKFMVSMVETNAERSSEGEFGTVPSRKIKSDMSPSANALEYVTDDRL